MTREFANENKVVCRSIQIRGDQTLEELHYAIFQAFDREEDHMYEFQVGGEGPDDPEARRYGLPGFEDVPVGDSSESDENVRNTCIGEMGLKVGDVLGYWFDFGDDWRHQITVTAIAAKAGRANYPRVSKRVGQSPQQYVNWDDEDA